MVHRRHVRDSDQRFALMALFHFRSFR
jgi:hypothetical protein